MLIKNVILKSNLPKELEEFPRTDPHCHTLYSDGTITLQTLIKLAKKRDFKVLMKADHDTLKGNQKLKKMCKNEGILFIPTVEFSTTLGHIVGINVEEWNLKTNDGHEIIEHLHSMNALAILAHPWWRIGLREDVFKIKEADGFEAINASSPLGSFHFLKDIYSQEDYTSVNKYNLPCFAGSDSHGGHSYGKVFTIFKTMDFSVDGILESIRKKEVLAVGSLLPIIPFLIDGVFGQSRLWGIKLRENKEKHKKKDHTNKVP